jgi:hypothetical protein
MTCEIHGECPYCKAERIAGDPLVGVVFTGIPKERIEDGFGSVWFKCKYGMCDLEVVRPGKVQCSGFCEGEVDDSHSSGGSDAD